MLAHEEQVLTAAAQERGVTPVAHSSRCYNRPTLGRVMKRKVSVAVQNPRCPGVSLTRTFGFPALHPCPARIPAPPAGGGKSERLQTQMFSEDATQPRASSVQADVGGPDPHP